MLSLNIGLGRLSKVAVLNKLTDKYGINITSLGSMLAFVTKVSGKNS